MGLGSHGAVDHQDKKTHPTLVSRVTSAIFWFAFCHLISIKERRVGPDTVIEENGGVFHPGTEICLCLGQLLAARTELKWQLTENTGIQLENRISYTEATTPTDLPMYPRKIIHATYSFLTKILEAQATKFEKKNNHVNSLEISTATSKLVPLASNYLVGWNTWDFMLSLFPPRLLKDPCKNIFHHNGLF